MIRVLARRVLGVERVPTYFLPWLTRPGLACSVLLSNVEARFKSGHNAGPFPVVVTQYDADGSVVARRDTVIPDSTSRVEVALVATASGHGFATVEGERLHSDLYVMLSDGAAYTVTHGRHEFIERYPARSRALVYALGVPLAAASRTIGAFVRHQYVYRGPDHRSHVLVMNLSNVRNHVRLTAVDAGDRTGRLLSLPPMGSALVDVHRLFPGGVTRLRLSGNAWFNIYLVGAGAQDVHGSLSLMHVK
jgi:hypothetical protein